MRLQLQSADLQVQRCENKPAPGLFLNTGVIGAIDRFILNEIVSHVLRSHERDVDPELKQRPRGVSQQTGLARCCVSQAYVGCVVSSVDVIQQQASEICIIRTADWDHENRQAEIG